LIFIYDNFKTQIIRQLGFTPKHISTLDDLDTPNSIALTINYE